MRNLYKVLIVLVVLGAGAAYYAKRKNIDLKSLFSSKCDCHTGCSLKKNTTPPPLVPVQTAIPITPEPIKTLAVASTSTPAELAPNVKPVSTPAPAAVPAK